MARGLLSRLNSNDPSRPIDEVRSILGNLRVLLNARLGNATTAPDFGVVDLCDMIHTFPDSTISVQRSIRDTIQKYEPRLTSIRVRSVPSENPLTLVFEVSARLASDRKRGLVRVRTEVSPSGRVQVE